jgi:AcrR family transcriptional regulator
MAGQPQTQSRSEKTKQRILSVAQIRFAADGYEGTTIRGVAEQAGIDPSMVMRYFGSKEGLFTAAASFNLHLPDLASIPKAKRGKRLAEHFLKIWEHEPAGGGLAILLRTAATNAAATERLLRIFRKQVVPAVAAVAPDAAAARAALISSQLLGMAYCRRVIQMPEAMKLKESILVSSLGRTIDSYLNDPL